MSTTQAQERALPDTAHVILFADKDRAPEFFSGAGAQAAAVARYEQLSAAWNVYLFAQVKGRAGPVEQSAGEQTGPVPARPAPVAFVPVHPRFGVLWSDAFPSDRDASESRPRSYPLMALYAAPVAENEDAALTESERVELLDWVTACQSAYYIESTRAYGIHEALRDLKALEALLGGRNGPSIKLHSFLSNVERFFINFNEFVSDWRNGDFDLPQLAALDVESCLSVWDSLPPEQEAQQPVSMDDAIAAGDGTLHGAIDYWQRRALVKEQAAQVQEPLTIDEMRHCYDVAHEGTNIVSRLSEFSVRVVRAVELACAEKWGVQLTKEGGNV